MVERVALELLPKSSRGPLIEHCLRLKLLSKGLESLKGRATHARAAAIVNANLLNGHVVRFLYSASELAEWTGIHKSVMMRYVCCPELTREVTGGVL